MHGKLGKEELMDNIVVYHGATQENLMEQNKFNNHARSPIMQEILMSNRIGKISMLLSDRLNIKPLRALKLFYESNTCALLHDKQTGLYLYSDPYIADEFIREYQI